MSVRAGRAPLAGQIYQAIRRAIETGRLASGARLPSWRDLAAQLGVSRGTVRVAYQRVDRRAIRDGFGAAGTRVAERPPHHQHPTGYRKRRLCRTSSMSSERRPSSTIDIDGEGSHRAMVQQELQILVLFYDQGGTHLFAKDDDLPHESENSSMTIRFLTPTLHGLVDYLAAAGL